MSPAAPTAHAAPSQGSIVFNCTTIMGMSEADVDEVLVAYAANMEVVINSLKRGIADAVVVDPDSIMLW